MSFFRKMLLELINFIFNNSVGLRLLGRLKIFNAVFVMYPADQEFADYYTFRFRQRFIAWKPFITGVITHRFGVRTLMFAISSHVDGRDSNYDPSDLKGLHTFVESLKGWLRADSTHFAGTLPGRLSALKVRRVNSEQRATVENVVKAVGVVRHTRPYPVVILGAKGYVGREVTKYLVDGSNLEVLAVDLDGVYQNGCRVSGEYMELEDPHLILNITHPEAINPYIDKMNRRTIVLNEVYPAPGSGVVSSMNNRGVDVYHIAGVKASVWPPFPGSYQGAVPCCAALPGENYEVVVVKL